MRRIGATFERHADLITLLDNEHIRGANPQYIKLTPLTPDRWVLHIMLSTGFVMHIDCMNGSFIRIASDIIHAASQYERSKGCITSAEAQEIEHLVCTVIGTPNQDFIALPPIKTDNPNKTDLWLSWLIRISNGLPVEQVLEQLRGHYQGIRS